MYCSVEQCHCFAHHQSTYRHIGLPYLLVLMQLEVTHTKVLAAKGITDVSINLHFHTLYLHFRWLMTSHSKHPHIHRVACTSTMVMHITALSLFWCILFSHNSFFTVQLFNRTQHFPIPHGYPLLSGTFYLKKTLSVSIHTKNSDANFL